MPDTILKMSDHATASLEAIEEEIGRRFRLAVELDRQADELERGAERRNLLAQITSNGAAHAAWVRVLVDRARKEATND